MLNQHVYVKGIADLLALGRLPLDHVGHCLAGDVKETLNININILSSRGNKKTCHL